MSQRIKNPEFFSQCHNPVLTPVTILPQGAGTVGAVRVTTGDTTVYTSPPAVTFTAGFGGGSGALGTAVLAGGSVVAVNVIAAGSGYAVPPTMTFAIGGGSGAAGTFVFTGGSGVIASVTMTAAGSGYISAPQVTVTGGSLGTGATLVGNIFSSVGSLYVSTAGSGYLSIPTVTLVGGGGSGATGAAVLSGGTVNSLTISAAGSGYVGAPTVVFSGGSGGQGAAGTAYVFSSVSGVTVTAGGSLYPAGATPSFAAGSGAGAAATAVLNPALGEGDTNQSYFTPSILNGQGVLAIYMTAGGSGYLATPLVTSTGGGGSGAVYAAQLSGGVVNSINVTNPGSGYTSAPTLTVAAPGGSGYAGGTATATAVQGTIQATGALILTTNDPYVALVYENTKESTGFTSVIGTPVQVASGNGTVGGSQCWQLPIYTKADTTSVGSLTVVGGSGYTFAPAVTVSGGSLLGNGLQVATRISGGTVYASIVNPGTGYGLAPILTLAGGVTGGSLATITTTLATAGGTDMPPGSVIRTEFWWRDTSVKP